MCCSIILLWCDGEWTNLVEVLVLRGVVAEPRVCTGFLLEEGKGAEDAVNGRCPVGLVGNCI